MMIKWKKQCEFCNKNLRMKTKIEAITNKRSEEKNRRLNGELGKLSETKQSHSDKMENKNQFSFY
ncbi:CLUMA_CG001865, isoform A [Clunio marinus]|uniref:CLUMA_CG001865, isoform A n=1 Tax=Clunio marinus TaxID=568069 RepID=A0A1J1HJ53_9DIPT|nr:CLUMA_CG001865, isoform A [Clunio marinus]